MRKTDLSFCIKRNSHLIDIIHPIYHITFLLCVYACLDLCTDAIPLSSDPLPLTHSLSEMTFFCRSFVCQELHRQMTFSSFSIAAQKSFKQSVL